MSDEVVGEVVAVPVGDPSRPLELDERADNVAWRLSGSGIWKPESALLGAANAEAADDAAAFRNEFFAGVLTASEKRRLALESGESKRA